MNRLFPSLRSRFYNLLRATEKYTQTDMVYAAKGSFWLHSANVVVSLGGFLLYVIFGHLVPKQVYGTYQYLLSVGAIVGAFTLTGISTAVTRSAARGFEGTFLESIRVQLIWGLVPLLGSWAVGAYYLLHGNATLGWGLFLIGIFIPINTTYNTFSAFLKGKKDFRRRFTYGLFVSLPYYASVALIAVSVPVALALLAANLISQAIGNVIAHYRTVALYKPNELRDPGAVRYGAHSSLMNVLATVVGQLDSVLVFHFLGAADLALYSFATAVPGRLGVFKPMAHLAAPKYAAKSHADIRHAIVRKASIGAAAELGVALIYMALAHPFFAIFFPRYMDAVPYSQIYALILATNFGTLFNTALVAHARIRALWTYQIIAPLLRFGLLFTGILWWGLWGLIWARILGNALVSLLTVGLFFAQPPHDRSIPGGIAPA